MNLNSLRKSELVAMVTDLQQRLEALEAAKTAAPARQDQPCCIQLAWCDAHGTVHHGSQPMDDVASARRELNAKFSRQRQANVLIVRARLVLEDGTVVKDWTRN